MPDDRLDSQRSAAEAERRDRDRRQLGAEVTATRRQRRGLYAGLAVLGLLAVVGPYFVVTSDQGTLSEARPLDRIEIDGEQLVLHWSGPECETVDPERSELVESGDEVRVTLYVDAPHEGCDGEPMERVMMVSLGGPVAQRDIIDGACLLPAFLDDMRCQSQNVRLDRQPADEPSPRSGVAPSGLERDAFEPVSILAPP